MADTQVILGGFVFQDFEVPAKIAFGGEHKISVHRLVGGARVVDAMGFDPVDKTWNGTFRGAAAIERARFVEAMCVSGAPVELSWFGLFYTVIVTHFQAETEKFYEVPYSITCTVVDDPANVAAALVSSLDALVSGDLASATSTGIVGLDPIRTTLASVGTLEGAAQATLASVAQSASQVSQSIKLALSADDALLDAVSPDGQDPVSMGTWLASMASISQRQSIEAIALPYVNRISYNTNVAVGSGAAPVPVPATVTPYSLDFSIQNNSQFAWMV